MALIKTGGLVNDIRGSQNGLTFSRNKGGAYVRQKVSPVQPVSPFSSLARAIFTSLSQAWATALTAAQRAAWVTFASTHTFVNVFGDSITLSGIAMYQSVNRAIQQIGKVRIDNAPTVFTAPAVQSFTPVAVITAGVISTLTQTTVLAGAVAMPASGDLYIFATPPMPPGVKPQKSDFRLINPGTYSAVTLTSAILTLYNNRFGTPGAVTGQQIAFRIAVLDWSTGAIGTGITVNYILP